jgi:hypothetical protein
MSKIGCLNIHVITFDKDDILSFFRGSSSVLQNAINRRLVHDQTTSRK